MYMLIGYKVSIGPINDSYTWVCLVLPAHDLVGQQDPTHLWVFILALIDNRLKDGEEKKRNHRRFKITVIEIFFNWHV